MSVTPQAALGFGWSIIPARGDKSSFVAWKPYQRARPTLDDLHRWQRQHRPSAWAVVTGDVSNIVTLDFDGPQRCETMKKLGLNPHRSTPSGGYHVDFEHPGWHVPTGNGKSNPELGRRWPGLDIRADGGYAVFTGRVDKGEYTWLRGPEPEDLSILPPDLREFLGLLHPPGTAIKTKPPSANVHCDFSRVDPETLIRRALERVATDGRNNRGFWLAAQLRDNGYSQAEAEGAMLDYRSRCPETNTKGQRETYTEHEVLSTVRKAYEESPREPWTPASRNGTSRNGAPRNGAGVQRSNVDASTVSSPAENRTEEQEDWLNRLIKNKDGSPKACLANAITALAEAPEWSGVLGFNEFTLTTVLLKGPPWNPKQKESDWTASDDIRLADWLQHHGILVQVHIAAQAVQAVAEKRKFHRVREYLDGLQWDGVYRLDEWLFHYLGVTPNDYSRAVGAKFCISAVARIYDPGCKVDTCLILQSKQGELKSTALRTLAVNPKWFTDELDEIGTKDSQLQVAGVWIIEISELHSLSRSESGRIKAFLSRQTDRFRPPYGMRLITAPRQCVFSGTVNPDTFLKDETGARRFWPVRVEGVDIPALTRDRDQLWAEAVHRYRAGETWWLDTPELIQQAEQEQAERYQGGVWDQRIAKWLRNPTAITGGPLHHDYEEASVSTDEILEHCIGKAPGNWTHSDEIAVSRAMTSLKWERFRSTEGDRPRRWRKERE